MNSKRVVSLIASATEILWALGKGELQVGRSHECDFPEKVRELPQVTWTKFDTDGRSYQIDQRVKSIVAEGLSVYGVDPEMLNELRPDVILTQDHCQVCAVSLGDVENAVCKIVHSNPRVVSLHPDSLDDIFRDIRQVAEAVNDPDAAERLIEGFHSRIEKVEQSLSQAVWKPRVAFVEWIEPLMAGGNWVPQLIEMAGGIDLLGEAEKHSSQLPLNSLREADPDIIIISPCGFGIARTLEEMPRLRELPWWRQLTSVQNDNVFIADGNRFFNRPGPGVIDSMEMLAEMFHPDLFEFGHRGRWWQRDSA